MNIGGKVLGLASLKQKLGKVSQSGRETLVQGLELSAIEVHSTAVRSIQKVSAGRRYRRGRKWHTASRPGDPPNVDTGVLVSGVKWEIDRRQLVAQVGTNVKHGTYMELGTDTVRARPWLKPALKLVQGKLAKMFLRGTFQKELRK